MPSSISMKEIEVYPPKMWRKAHDILEMLDEEWIEPLPFQWKGSAMERNACKQDLRVLEVSKDPPTYELGGESSLKVCWAWKELSEEVSMFLPFCSDEWWTKIAEGDYGAHALWSMIYYAADKRAADIVTEPLKKAPEQASLFVTFAHRCITTRLYIWMNMPGSKQTDRGMHIDRRTFAKMSTKTSTGIMNPIKSQTLGICGEVTHPLLIGAIGKNIGIIVTTHNKNPP